MWSFSGSFQALFHILCLPLHQSNVVFFQYKTKDEKKSIIFWIISSFVPYFSNIKQNMKKKQLFFGSFQAVSFFRYCRFLLRLHTFERCSVDISLFHSQHHAFHQFASPERTSRGPVAWVLGGFISEGWKDRKKTTKKRNQKRRKKKTRPPFFRSEEAGCRAWSLKTIMLRKKRLPPNVKLRQLRWEPPNF